MSVATFTPELKQNKDGTYTIRIRITKFQKHAYWNIGKRITKSQWNKKPSPKLHNYVIDHERAKQINNDIKNALNGLDDVASALPAATSAGIKEAYIKALQPEPEDGTTSQEGDYFRFADDYVQRAEDDNERTGKKYTLFLRGFKKVAGENSSTRQVLSIATLHKYMQAMKAKGNGPKTLRDKIRFLQSVYNAGLAANQLPDLGDPFAGIKIVVTKRKKVRPAAEQVKQFIDYTPKTEAQRIAKLVTLMQYLLQGARIAETLTLQWAANVHPQHIEYLPGKRAKFPKYVPRSEMLNKILKELPRNSRYVLPLLSDSDALLPAKKFNNKIDRLTTEVNEALKEIAEALEINIKLSSHMFRHAFADALIAAGANPHYAASLLGHSSAKTSEDYFKELQIGDTSWLALSVFNKLKPEANEGEL